VLSPWQTATGDGAHPNRTARRGWLRGGLGRAPSRRNSGGASATQTHLFSHLPRLRPSPVVYLAGYGDCQKLHIFRCMLVHFTFMLLNLSGHMLLLRGVPCSARKLVLVVFQFGRGVPSKTLANPQYSIFQYLLWFSAATGPPLTCYYFEGRKKAPRI